MAKNYRNPRAREHSHEGEINIVVEELHVMDTMAAEKYKHGGEIYGGPVKRQEVMVEVPNIKSALRGNAQGKAGMKTPKEVVMLEPKVGASRAELELGAQGPVARTSQNTGAGARWPTSNLDALRRQMELLPGK